MENPYGPPSYATFSHQENEFSLHNCGYRVLCTVLIGSLAIVADLVVYFTLAMIKRCITKYLVTEDLRFVVDLLFGLINLSVTAWLAYFVDGRLRIFWMSRKYGLNNSFSLF